MSVIKVKPGTPQKLDATDNPSFETWMDRVNKIIARHFFGVDTNDLPDQRYYDWYQSRMRPIWAAKRAVKNAGGEE